LRKARAGKEEAVKRHRLLLSLLIGSMLMLPSFVLAQEEVPTGPSAGALVSAGVSVTIPTEGLATGLEVWELWLSKTPGVTYEVPGSDLGKDTVLVYQVSGSAVATAENEAYLIRAGGVLEVIPAGQEFTTNPGDGEYGPLRAPADYTTAASGDEPAVAVVMSIGTPWVPGMADYGAIFGAGVIGDRIDDWSRVEEEMLASDAITLSIRVVTMAPGDEIKVVEPYPIERFILSGRMTTWAETPTVEVQSTVYSFGSIVPWFAPTQEIWRMIANEGTEPLVYAEFSVTPA
jgi:hypothetical protein